MGFRARFVVRITKVFTRAGRLEDDACRVQHAQAQDIMRALALLYREMAEELEESGLYERRFPTLDVMKNLVARESECA